MADNTVEIQKSQGSDPTKSAQALGTRTSKKNTTWHAINPGDVVSFRYKSTTGSRRSILREVICLDPMYRYRKKSTGRIIQLFIGLEIDNQERPALRPIEIRELMELLSRAGQKFDRGQVTAGQQARIRAIYTSIESFLIKYPIFKTYLLRECRKYRVFEENKYVDLQVYKIKGGRDQKNLIEDVQENIKDIAKHLGISAGKAELAKSSYISTEEFQK